MKKDQESIFLVWIFTVLSFYIRTPKRYIYLLFIQINISTCRPALLTNSTERGTRHKSRVSVVVVQTECGISWWRWVGLPNRLRLAISPANRFAIRVRRCNLLVMGSPPVKSSISPVFPGQIGDFPFVSSIKSGRLLCEACMLLDLFLSVRPLHRRRPRQLLISWS